METLEQAERLAERFKQEKKIRIATVDRCVMCGEIIPEGRQICWKCKYKTEPGETINCIHYVPPWKGDKTSCSQPDFCLKLRIILYGECIKGCKEQNK